MNDLISLIRIQLGMAYPKSNADKRQKVATDIVQAMKGLLRKKRVSTFSLGSVTLKEYFDMCERSQERNM